jgi:hypothetical protein
MKKHITHKVTEKVSLNGITIKGEIFKFPTIDLSIMEKITVINKNVENINHVLSQIFKAFSEYNLTINEVLWGLDIITEDMSLELKSLTASEHIKYLYAEGHSISDTDLLNMYKVKDGYSEVFFNHIETLLKNDTK